jgi:hypothetical protein
MDDQMLKDEMGGAYGTYGVRKGACRILEGTLKEGDHL